VLFSYLNEFCTAYVDNILIFSENPAKHHEHVIQMLEKLKSAGLQANIKKSEFSVTKTKFLKYIISTEGIAVDPDKISAIMKWERPIRIKELQSFLGFCNFYRLFIEDFSRVAKPLHRLTAATEWEWTQEQQRAFEHLKQALTSAPVLVHFDETRATKLETDASDGVVSEALSQLTDQKEWHPIAFFLKTMNPA
jgi:molecular chaperone DnaK (HSP70)